MVVYLFLNHCCAAREISNEARSFFSKNKNCNYRRWGYGCHAAESIMSQKPGSLVTIFEKSSDIFSGISGTFGNRLHVGAHYPRSSLTRELCHEGYKEFYIKYPELINEHSHSLYGLGVKDAGGNPSKVNKEEFAAVCQEFGEAKEIPITDNCPNLHYVADIKEPSLVMGIQLPNFFKKRLKDLGVDIHCKSDFKLKKE